MAGPTWTQRDGTTISVAEMSDGHLLNALRMLRRSRRADEIVFRWACAAEGYAADAPDGAAMAAESWARAIQRRGGEQDHLLSQEWKIFKELLTEVERRSLRCSPAP